MSGLFFLDTNIALACFDSTQPRKQTRAKDLLTHGANSQQGVVSFQVLQEFCNVASNARRLRLETDAIMAFISHFLQPMNQVAPSPELLAAALQVRAQNDLAFYDSMIIAAALQAQCETLFSEDLRHRQWVTLEGKSLRIENPFLDAVNEDTR